MSRDKVLWLSNKIQTDQDRGNTGTWLDAMARRLTQTSEIDLANIAQGAVAEPVRQDCGSIRQWIIPAGVQLDTHTGSPPASITAAIIRAVDEFSPDVVQVWGAEKFWGLLTARGLVAQPALLEMQGLKSAIARVYAGSLSVREQLACIGPKELLRGSTIFQNRRRFERWVEFERAMLAGHRFMTAQSAWLAAQIRAVNQTARIFHNDFLLREPFYAAAPWHPPSAPIIFCSASYPSPFKGLHLAIRALALLKRRFPDVQLRVAGAWQRPGLRQEGYVAWINRLARQLGVAEQIKWLGAVNATELVSELQQCALVLVPTFVEGYCLALAEAMQLGVPAVVAFVGGAAGLAVHGESALFFPPGDVAMSAYQMEQLLTDRTLAERLGRQARAVALTRNEPATVIQRQIEIYRQIQTSRDGVQSGTVETGDYA